MQTFLKLLLLIKLINFWFGWWEQIQETLGVVHKGLEKFHLKFIIHFSLMSETKHVAEGLISPSISFESVSYN